MKTTSRLLYLTFYGCIMLTACHKKDVQPAPDITFNKQTLTVDYHQGKDSITVTSTKKWTIQSLPVWVRTNVSSGDTGNTKVLFYFSENKSLESRTAEIMFMPDNNNTGIKFKLIQSAVNEPFLMVNSTHLIISPAGGQDSILVTSNKSWSFSIPSTASWLTADKMQGDSGVTKVHFTFPANNEKDRNVQFTITSTNNLIQPVNITFDQALNTTITSIYPTQGPVGTIVFLRGKFYLSDPHIKVDNIDATLLGNNDTLVRIAIPQGATSGKITGSYNGFTFQAPANFTVTANTQPNTWIKRSDATNLFSPSNDIESFEYNNKIYFGLNSSGKFYLYDPSTYSWSEGPSIPSTVTARRFASLFKLKDNNNNEKIYVGSGYSFNSNYLNDWWEYDPGVTDPNSAWKKIANFPVRYYGFTAFNSNNNGYVVGNGLITKLNLNNTPSSWDTVAYYNGQSIYKFNVTIGNYVYFGSGWNSRIIYKFDPSNNTVTEFDNAPVDSQNPIAFSVNNKAYIIFNKTDLYQYDPTATQKWIYKGIIPHIDYIQVVNNKVFAWVGDGTMLEYIPE